MTREVRTLTYRPYKVYTCRHTPDTVTRSLMTLIALRAEWSIHTMGERFPSNHTSAMRDREAQTT